MKKIKIGDAVIDQYENRQEIVNITEISPNNGQYKDLPANPRYIKNSEFRRLKESIMADPSFIYVKPLYVNEEGVILGGNMRYKAYKDLGIEEIPVVRFLNMPVSAQARLILIDNDQVGETDTEKLVAFEEQVVKLHVNPVLLEDDEKLEQKQLDQKYTDSNAIYPLIPVYDEKYNAVVIICETKTEFAQLRTKLNMTGKKQSYKNTFLGETNIINYKDIDFEKINSKPQKGE